MCSKLIQVINNISVKAYSQISDRGHSQKFEKLNILHLFIALQLEMHFPKRIEQKLFQGQIRAIFPEILMYEDLFNTVV